MMGVESKRRATSAALVVFAPIAVIAGVPGQSVPTASAAPPVGTIIFQDDFETGDLGKWDQVDSRRYAVTSTPGRVLDGSYALEGTIDSSAEWGEINKWFLPGYDRVYFKFDVMFEEGFANLRGDGHGMHFASVAGNRIDNKWSSHGQAGIVPNGNDFFVTTVDPSHAYNDPDLDPFMFYSYFPDMNCCYGNVFYQTDPKVAIVPGQWHEIIVEVDAGTPGGSNGSQTLWIDGQVKIDVQGIRWRDTADLRLNEVAIVNYMPDPPKTQHIWFDNVMVSTEFPGSDPVLSGPFVDVPANHPFVTEISWLADQGITLGCNSPANTQYCPTAPVTRAQMASFLKRALALPVPATDYFVDDTGSIHEPDINAIAQAFITYGCNPPANNNYCPHRTITRAEMAALLVRALGLTDDGGGNTFVDDDGSEFEADIAKLAAAGITKGCNPPANDRFCPADPVDRGQMAAFLYRALG